ncbi:hypothetical protein H4R18_003768 [Coemansia javaensis]|uniref:S1 motif domain-containing protein n=1 Tax=Coemansia javaensis TaxID=2761396 RepID=A0A9W8HEA5_9FUNG|nr:hypothetical protein H4R18_003768 [Coemansia javaensis]
MKGGCRYYESRYPAPGDVVMATIAKISDDGIGAYVTLAEYEGIEGMIQLSELSRRRIRSVQKMLRVGQSEPMVVLRVDEDKGYIDLTKKTISVDEIQSCKDKYKMSSKVHTIITHVAQKLERDPEQLYIKFGWPLYAKYGHAYNAFKTAVSDPDAVFGEFGLDKPLLDELMKDILRHMKPQQARLHAKIEVKCMGYQGIEGIRKALKAIEAESTEDTTLQVTLIASPLYIIRANSVNVEDDIQLINRGIKAAEEVIKQEGGVLKVVVSPKQVTEVEEKELKELMDRAERENAEVTADEDEDADGY